MLLAGAPARRRRAARRPADARAVQRDLLRARVSRAAARLPARRGRRPDGAPRSRVSQDGLRTAAACTRFCGAWTTTTAIRWSCDPIRRSASRVWCRPGAPGTCSSPTRSAWASSNRRRCSRFCRRSASGCSASRSRRRRSPPGGAARPPRSTSRPPPAEGVIKPAFPTRRWSRCSLGPRRERATRMGGPARHDSRCVRRRGVPAAVARAGLARRRLESRALMLRVFLVADGRGDYRVMPGGLARIAGDDRQSCRGSGAAAARTPGSCRTRRSPAAPSSAAARTREAARRAPDVEPRRRAPVLAGPLRGAQRERARGCSAPCSAG